MEAPAAPSFASVCGVVPAPLCRCLSARATLAAFCTARGVLGAGSGAAVPARHLRLDRRGRDGHGEAVLQGAAWAEVESVRGLQTRLYEVQEGLKRAGSLRELEVELVFPEALEEILPLSWPCAASLRSLTFRCCYAGVLESLAQALEDGFLPQLRSLSLQRSPKGAVFQMRHLQWPPRRCGLGNGSQRVDIAQILAAAVVSHARLKALRIERVVEFDAGDCSHALAAMAERCQLLHFAVCHCGCLGHNAMCALLSALTEGSPGLLSLELAPEPMSLADYDQPGRLGASLGEALCGLRRLKRVRLSWGNLDTQGGEALAAVLAASSPSECLETADFSNNKLGASLQPVIASMLGFAPRLARLSLGGNEPDAAARAAAGAAKSARAASDPPGPPLAVVL